MIDKSEVEYRFRRSIDSYDDNASVQKAMIAHLVELLKEFCPEGGKRVLEVGCGTGLLTKQMEMMYPDNRLYVNDLVHDMCTKTVNRCRLSEDRMLCGDVETMELPVGFDWIVSSSTFQWFTAPEATFTHLAHALMPAGWLIFSTFGPDNFKELRSITGQGLVYHSIDRMKQLLAPCYEVLYAHEESCTLHFSDPIEILHHIKKTGVNAMNLQEKWTPARLEKFVEEYTRRFRISGAYPLTYHPQYFVCRKR